MVHWTKALRDENAALKIALASALLAMRTIPAGRFDKYANCGYTESTIAYRKAVQEIDRLNRAAITNINDALSEAGA